MIPLIIGSVVIISGIFGYSWWNNKKEIGKIEYRPNTNVIKYDKSLNDKLICELKDKIRSYNNHHC